MLVIVVLVLLSVIATVVAMIMASPLFRTITLAIDSWADAEQGAEQLR
jgi:hypothetical protein